MKVYNYTVFFEPLEEGAYNVVVPASARRDSTESCLMARLPTALPQFQVTSTSVTT